MSELLANRMPKCERFFGRFRNVSDVWREFDIKPSECNESGVLFAWYDCEQYSGRAHLLLMCHGLHEVVVEHCSCDGLRDTWRLEKVTLDSLRMRPFAKSTYDGSGVPSYSPEALIALRRVCGVPDGGLP